MIEATEDEDASPALNYGQTNQNEAREGEDEISRSQLNPFYTDNTQHTDSLCTSRLEMSEYS